jgi:hypothetical protein
LNLTDNIDGTFDIVLGGNLSVASATDSHKAINSIDLAMQMVSADRAMFGALSNRFDMSISNLSNVAANSEMSLGRLQDADFAAETSRMTTSRILEQAFDRDDGAGQCGETKRAAIARLTPRHQTQKSAPAVKPGALFLIKKPIFRRFLLRSLIRLHRLLGFLPACDAF